MRERKWDDNNNPLQPFDGVEFVEEDCDLAESIGFLQNGSNNDTDASTSSPTPSRERGRGAWKERLKRAIFLSAAFLAGRTIAPSPSRHGEDLLRHLRNKGSFDAWLAQVGPTPAHLARNVRPVVDLPTNTSSFAFFHLRKAGGQTLRYAIYDAVTNHGRAEDELWVPCKNVHCFDFDRIPRNTLKAVYASHINYEELVRARREVAQERRAMNPRYQAHSTLTDGKGTTTYYHLDDTLHHFDCLTNLRSTVSRVVSCYNFRFKEGDRGFNWQMPYPDELTPEDWTSLLPEAYDTHSGGCNNELERAFGSLNDETIINTMTRDSPYFDQELQRSASRMAQCVIVILDRCEESNAVLRHYLPWLGEQLDLCTTHANTGKTSDVHKHIREGSDAAILKQNDMDEALFQFGRELFEEQVRIAQSA